MKLSRRFKIILFLSLFLLYTTGTAVWAMNRWFPMERGMGPEPRPQSIFLLHTHSIVSLWFLLVFGYLWHSHVLRGIRAKKKRKSGLALVAVFAVLILTVPALFYLTDEKQKLYASQIHSYLGLFLIAPFFLHILLRVKRAHKQ